MLDLAFHFKHKGPFLLFSEGGVFFWCHHWEWGVGNCTTWIRAAECGLRPFAEITGNTRFPTVREHLQLPPVSSPNCLFFTCVTLSGIEWNAQSNNCVIVLLLGAVVWCAASTQCPWELPKTIPLPSIPCFIYCIVPFLAQFSYFAAHSKVPPLLTVQSHLCWYFITLPWLFKFSASLTQPMHANLAEIWRLYFPLGTRRRQVWCSARAYWDILWGSCVLSHTVLVFMLFGFKSSLAGTRSSQRSCACAMPLSAFHAATLCTYLPASLIFTWCIQDLVNVG